MFFLDFKRKKTTLVKWGKFHTLDSLCPRGQTQRVSKLGNLQMSKQGKPSPTNLSGLVSSAEVLLRSNTILWRNLGLFGKAWKTARGKWSSGLFSELIFWHFCVLPCPCPLSLPGNLLPFLLNPTSLLRAGPRGSLLLLLSVSHLLPPCRDGTLQNLVSVHSLPWLGPSFFPSPYLALPLSSRPMFLSFQGKSQLAYPSDTWCLGSN